MKHARPAALDALEPILAQVRTLDGMKEKKRVKPRGMQETLPAQAGTFRVVW